MATRVSKPAFNIREKLSELDRPVGTNGSQLLKSNDAAESFEIVRAGRKNIIINGDQRISQRGTTFSPNGSLYCTDRFQQRISGSSVTYDTTVTQADTGSELPGFTKCYKVTPDTADTSLSGSDNAMIKYVVEGYDAQQFGHGTPSAKPMTLSFYAKSGSQNSGHQYAIQLRKYDTAGTNRHIVNKPFIVTTSWQRFFITVDGDAAIQMRNNNEKAIEIMWHLAAGPDDIIAEQPIWNNNINLSGSVGSPRFSAVTGQSNFLDNTSNEFYLTGVQLEVGSEVTPFEFRPYSQELLLCQRYYQQIVGNSDMVCAGPGRSNGTTNAPFSVPLSVPLAESPTVNSCAWSVFTPHTQTNVTATPSVVKWDANSSVLTCQLAGLSGMTNGRSLTVFLASSSTFTIDAEL